MFKQCYYSTVLSIGQWGPSREGRRRGKEAGGGRDTQEITRQAQPRNQTTVSEYLSVDLEKGLSDLIYIVI
jgi:hypothetical protein